MKPTKITLELENCEVLEFDWKDVNIVVFDKTWSGVVFDEGGEQTVLNYCSKFFIEIKSGDAGSYTYDNGSAHWTKRLRRGDITCVNIYYGGKRDVISYLIKWPNAHEHYHPHQGVNLEDDNTWLIYCCKELKKLL